jgi:hypothetical protein
MENAWLDSLSEDWISQPPSTGSPTDSLPSLSTGSITSTKRVSSRIPIPNGRIQSAPRDSDSIPTPLSERSSNDSNIPLSQRETRKPSKLRKELSNGTRGRRLSRTLSESTTDSVQHHTIQHKSLSSSPQKLRGSQDIPEWRKRLLHGEVAYGEQRDLFSPAGLENIFRQPVSQNPLSTKSPERFERGDLSMPSSPPPYARNNQRTTSLTEEMEEKNHDLKRKEPRAMKYKVTDVVADQFSEDDISRSSSFRPALSTSRRASNKVPPKVIPEDEEEESETLSQFKGELPGSRIVSGQSDTRHEGLSPIFISRHNTIDGGIAYAALNNRSNEPEHRLEDISIEDQSEIPQFREESLRVLPENTTGNTDDFNRIGTFVNVVRGGKSEDGSFRQRPLSPSSMPLIDESAMIQECSVEASTPKEMPHLKKQRAPEDSLKPLMESTKALQGNDAPKRPGSGSPLKLFGTYDTFTNQKLLRRLSQFENSLHDETGGSKDNEELGESGIGSTHYTEMNEAFIAPSSPSKSYQKRETSGRTTGSIDVNIFGDGQLNHFEFSDEGLESSRVISEGLRKGSPVTTQNHDLRQGFTFHLQPSPTLGTETKIEKHTKRINTVTKQRVITTRNSIRHVSKNSDTSAALHVSQQLEVPDTPRKRYGDNESKRLPRSPLKNPTPKRRRTLHKIDMLHPDSDVHLTDSVRESHEHVQSVVNRKRKDARHGDNQETANPQVMAMRQVLRPRTPTPNQRSIKEQKRNGLHSVTSTSQQVAQEQQEKIARAQAELDATAPLQPSNAIGGGQSMQNEARKGSVTTQDFLDEAKKIMAGIRGKARPSGGLGSVEESESENDKHFSLDDPSFQESTAEPFSRPPSRDGAPLYRLPQKQQDPVVLDHLRKYEEMSDFGGIIASSLKSISLARDAVNAANEVDRITDETLNRASSRRLTLDGIYESDPPNIQITEYPELQRKRKHSTSSAPAEIDGHPAAEFPSHGSSASSGVSTARTIPTGSSRGSDSKHVIAPHTVSHLIPEQLGGMVFDREKRIWIKRKTVSGNQTFQNNLPSDDTDDDPFGDIPDLTVDETQELHRIQAVAARKREEARISEVQNYRKSVNVVERLDIDEQKPLHHVYNESNAESTTSSEPTKLTRLASNTPEQPGTRLTSWGNDAENLVPKAIDTHQMQTTREFHNEEEVIEEVEQEISIHEDRVEPEIKTRRRRNITISFSSPVASVIPPDEHDDSLPNESDDNHGQNMWRRSYTSKFRSSQQAAPRSLSLGGHTFVARPVSRIDEHEEESSVDHIGSEYGRRSVSLVVSTPLPIRAMNKDMSMVAPSSANYRSEGLLQLTPLSEFTINQPDESFVLEASYIDQRRYRHSSLNGRRTLSLSVKELVQRITDVEPYEPFWEYIKQLELRDKKLQTLHMLSKFCGQLEELDVSKNEISQLEGAPIFIRDLRIANNCLSDLTSWAHLANLQYVDVSNNNLTSLESFKHLVHLRGLRADNNKIQSLKGITNLDGLISLRLRGNLVQSIDFAESTLHRLIELDLKGNSVREVRNLQELRSLTTLNLEENDLGSFPAGNCDALFALKYLKLGGNNLEELDVSGYPNLRLLYLDRNRLQRVTGLHKTKHLDSLSLREQQDGSLIDPAFLNEAFEVRKLFLSGNLLTTFAPTVDFLNLQYLELANCGLEMLPMRFGQMVSNVRVLNLNFNALRDIKPLLGIVRLKRLHLAGNRLARLRKTTNVLAQFPHLTKADLRNNPLTLGFYPPTSEKRLIVHDAVDDSNEFLVIDPFTLQDADREKDNAYAGRLDMETKMRRRVFEMLMLGGCARLKMLDGLVVDRLGLGARDRVWEELVKAGLIYDSITEICGHGHKAQTSETVAQSGVNVVESMKDEHIRKEAPLEVLHDERWPAEDSFA